MKKCKLNYSGFFISMVCLVLFSCSARTVYVQPHISPVAVEKILGDEAGIYISPDDLSKTYTKDSTFGGKFRVPLGSPLKECAQEAFLPFFKRVYFIGAKNFSDGSYVIEVSLTDYEVTEGLDTHLTLSCTISTSEKTIFSGDFTGDGSGSVKKSLFNEDMAREEMRESTEEAFIQAFKKAQTKLNENLKE